MNPSPSTPACDLVEQQLHEVSALLASGEALQLQAACARLQSIGVELLQARDTAALPQPHLLAARLQHWQALLATVREQLSRRSSQVQQSLQVLLPVPAGATYAPAGVAVAPFGTALRQSGSLRGLAA